jgi:YfiH family protein
MMWSGMAFSDGDDGHQREPTNRQKFAQRVGAKPNWAELQQVHGSRVLQVSTPGLWGEADAMFTSQQGLPLAVFGADCPTVLISSATAVGAAHSGWRGTAAGVVPELLRAMKSEGHDPKRASVGPAIAACCFEVGPEVLDRFRGFEAETTWGTASVDLGAVIAQQLSGLEVDVDKRCTRCDPTLPSHRRDGTSERLVGLAWLV